MNTYIKTIQDKDGNIILPRTRIEAVYMTDGITTLENALGTALLFKGTIATYSLLPSTDLKVGDMYYVTADESHYFWNGTVWAVVGGASAAVDVEFTPYGGIAATNVQNALQELDDEKATKASPTFTGAPSAPTAAVGTDSTQLATTAFVNAEITNDRPWEETATNIKMNGTQAVGVLSTIARGDHIHPTDTSRAASSHTHGNITNAGAIGTIANLAVMTTTSGVLTTGTIPVASGGTGATTAATALTNLGLTATNSEINILDIAAGSAGKFLKSNGTTATWEIDNDTIYTHPTGFSSQPGTALSGANVISQVTVDTNGHTTGVTSRALTAGDVGAAASSHTHNYAGSASVGGPANSISSPDGDRIASNKLPTTSPNQVRFDFASSASAETGGNYAGVMTYAPWLGTTASTGDASYQLAFGSTAVNASGMPKLNIRNGIDSTWNSWYTILHSGNVSTYALPIGGGLLTGKLSTQAANSTMALNDGGNVLEVRNVSGATGDGGMAMMAFHDQGTYAIKMGLRSDGYFGLGGWSRAAWSWYSDPSGNMTAAGNVTAYSDPRLKENFKNIENPIDKVKQLNGGTFNWKEGFEHTSVKAGKKDYGILANEVQAIMPEIVTESIEIEGEKYKTVDYSRIVPLLIEAIKEQQKQIDELKALVGK